MNILSHRGYWKTSEEKNLPIAFRRSFDLGFGTETDIRDCAGRLLVSHDPPKGDEISLDDLLDLLDRRNLPLAVNVKADGNALALKAAMEARNYVNWFTFDMSLPEMTFQLRHGLRVYTRVSDCEPAPLHYEASQGVWLDAFYSDWYSEADVAKHLIAGKEVCIVSPELHRRDHAETWERLKMMPCVDDPRLSLCTDFPEDAQAFFGRKK